VSASPEGTGPLRQVLQHALDEAALNDRATSLADYTVLSPQNDPYRLDLPDNHRAGKWFAEIVERLVPELNAARTAWYEQALPLLQAHPLYQEYVAQIENALTRASEAVAAFHAAQDAARDRFEEIELPRIEPPEPELSLEPPTPLFATDEDFYTATRHLIAHKALESD
jgi:hypothetical protein